MSLFDIYKAKKLGLNTDEMFASLVGKKMSDGWKKGFNIWDEQWEVGGLNNEGVPIGGTDRIRSKNYIPVTADTDYYFMFKYGLNEVGLYAYWFDTDKNYISMQVVNNLVRTSPSNAAYLKFRTYPFSGYSYTAYEPGDICINVSGEHNGEYVPYDG